MPVKTIYIARHGFRLNWTKTFWKNITGIAKDPPLSVYGEAQAKELAAYLAYLPENERPTAIFTSPYYRCIQTCLPIADALSLPLWVEFGLSEWYSPVTPGTGLHPRPAPADDLQQYFPRSETATTTTINTNTNVNANGSYIDPRWKPTYLVTRRGETVTELYARCEEFLRALIARVEGEGEGVGVVVGDGEVGVGHERILLVSHAATTIALVRALTGGKEIERSMRVGCCTLTTLHRSPAPSLLSNSSWSSASALLPPSVAGSGSGSSAPPSIPSLPPHDVIGKGVWTVRGTPADGSFLAGGVERSWGMEDVEMHEGVVLDEPGVPGSEDEEDAPNGVQVWRQAGVLPLPKPKM